ncbi:MAG: hypothetical protein LBG04_03390 [Holosporaceae bacterium]|nr:hypothetical protein [Holosporaceae bacterium]
MSEAIVAQNSQRKNPELTGQASRLQEVFIPLKINTRKGRAAVVIKPKDYFANTQLSRLLAKAEILENQLIKSAENGVSLKEFCEVNKISPRYVRSIISMNNLSPKIKKMIMEGEVPQHVSVEKIKNYRFPMVWREQEMWFNPI